MVYDASVRTGQGKLPQELVTDNALLKRKYESEELEGAWPVLSTTSDGEVVITGITASTAAPNNADGQPDGTVYIQVA